MSMTKSGYPCTVRCKNSLRFLQTVTLPDVERTVKMDSENNTCFTLSTVQDFHCWQHWNRYLALAQMTKGLAIAARLWILTVLNTFGGNRKVKMHI